VIALFTCACARTNQPVHDPGGTDGAADAGIIVQDVAASESDLGPVGPACKPNEIFCLDNRTRARCDTDGLGYKPIGFCSDGFSCAAGAICRPKLCFPDGLTCLSTSTAVRCDASGTGFLADEVTCGENTLCLEGECRPKICALDDTRCSGGQAQRCVRLGTEWAPLDMCAPGVPGCGICAGPTSTYSCSPSPAGVVGPLVAVECEPDARCLGGVCLPRICEPGILACVSAAASTATGLALCTPFGSSWQVQSQSCPAGTADSSATCLHCLPNGHVIDCFKVPTGTDVTALGTSCEPGDICERLFGCTRRECAPGAVRCGTGGELRRCNLEGSAWLTSGPGCEAYPCTHCESDQQSASCDGVSGTAELKPCGVGEACVPSAGCMPYDCEAAALRCDASGAFIQCGPDGFGEVPLSCGAYGDCADDASGFGCDCGDGPGCRALSGCVPEVGTGVGSGGTPELRVTFQGGVSVSNGERFVHIAPVVDPSTGLPIDGLAPAAPGQPGVSLTEDGVARPLTCEHLLLSPDAALDLVFVLDVTSSMGAALDALRDNLLALAVALGKSGLDARFGAVGFGDSVPLESVAPLPLTEDLQTFGEVLQTWQVVNGGDAPESGLDALAYSHGAMTWRPGAQRALVLVTDAPLHDAFDGSGASTASLVALLDELAGQASVHVIGPGEGRPAFEQARWPTAELVGCASGGSRQSLAEFLANPVADSPLVRGLSQSLFCTYESADPSAAHTLTVTVRAEVAGEVLKGSRTR
jgi:hypothetical protein